MHVRLDRVKLDPFNPDDAIFEAPRNPADDQAGDDPQGEAQAIHD